jgi:hypothetical protein
MSPMPEIQNCRACGHAHGDEPIFDEWEDGDEMFGRECGTCPSCFEQLQERVAQDRADRPAQWR